MNTFQQNFQLERQFLCLFEKCNFDSRANDVITLESQWQLESKYLLFEYLLDFKAIKSQSTLCNNTKVIRI